MNYLGILLIILPGYILANKMQESHGQKINHDVEVLDEEVEPEWLYYSPTQMNDDTYFANTRPPEDGWHQATVEPAEGTPFGEVWQLAAYESSNNLILRSRNFNAGMAEDAGNPDGVNGVTFVYRVRGVSNPDYDPTDDPLFWPGFRIQYEDGGNTGIRPVIGHEETGFVILNSEVYDESLGEHLFYPLDNDEFITLRLTLKDQMVALYVNEEEEPIILDDFIDNPGNAWRITMGDDAGWANMAGEIAWVGWSLSGAYSPAEFALPELLQVSDDDPQTYALNIIIDPEEGGSADGAGDYEEGDNVTLSANPADGFSFVNWTREGAEISNEASFDFVMLAEEVTLAAHFEADDDTSIDALGFEDMMVYPNPLQNVLNIKAPFIMHRVTLIDLTGKIVLDKIVNGDQAMLNLDLNNGMYLLRIQTENDVVTARVQVIR